MRAATDRNYSHTVRGDILSNVPPVKASDCGTTVPDRSSCFIRMTPCGTSEAETKREYDRWIGPPRVEHIGCEIHILPRDAEQ